jgi:hypothetical protein
LKRHCDSVLTTARSNTRRGCALEDLDADHLAVPSTVMRAFTSPLSAPAWTASAETRDPPCDELRVARPLGRQHAGARGGGGETRETRGKEY